jgi:predicted DNA-binding transcriptional regulator YafY
LTIGYNKSFRRPKCIVISPYFLKEYNNRWFLFGTEKGYKSISNLALDRIESVEYDGDEEYEETDIDFANDYFEDVIGITIPKDPQVIEVVLKFSDERFDYVESKPLHGSQKCDRENCIVRIKVIHNRELESLILHYGSDVEVLQPESLRKAIKEKILRMNTFYNQVYPEK